MGHKEGWSPQDEFPREYFRLISVNLEDESSVHLHYPDGAEVWENLLQIQFWSRFQRYGPPPKTWSELDRRYWLRRAALAYCRWEHRRAGVPVEQSRSRIRPVWDDFARTATAPLDRWGHCWAGLLVLQHTMHKLVFQAATDKAIDTGDLGNFNSFVRTIHCSLDLEKDPVLAADGNRYVTYAARSIRRGTRILRPIPGLSSLTWRTSQAIYQLAEDLSQGVRFTRCPYCANGLRLVKGRGKRCYACDPKAPERHWKAEHREELTQQQRDNRRYHSRATAGERLVPEIEW